MMTSVLLTGFGPFGGHARNPSGQAVVLARIGLRRVARVATEVLPVSFADAPRLLLEALEREQPDVVICTGLAAGRTGIAVERFAANLIDARIPDIDGIAPIDVPVDADAPGGHIATVPVKAITKALVEARYHAELSMSAGTYVCNQVFFTALEWASTHPSTRVGFIHVPWANGQVPPDQPSLPLDRIARAIEIVVTTTLANDSDLAESGGNEH